jgi:hypothetical protein
MIVEIGIRKEEENIVLSAMLKQKEVTLEQLEQASMLMVLSFCALGPFK